MQGLPPPEQDTHVQPQPEFNEFTFGQTDTRLYDAKSVHDWPNSNSKIENLKYKIAECIPKILSHSKGCSCESEVCRLNVDLLDYFMTREFERPSASALDMDRPASPD